MRRGEGITGAAAADRAPVMIAADRSRATPTAGLYIDDVVPPEIHALFESASAGDWEGSHLVVIPRAYDKLYYYLKEIYRRGDLPRCLRRNAARSAEHEVQPERVRPRRPRRAGIRHIRYAADLDVKHESNHSGELDSE